MNKTDDSLIKERLAIWDALSDSIKHAIRNGAEIPDLKIIIQPEKEVKNNMNGKITLIYEDMYLDGGTRKYLGSDGNTYYADYRLKTITEGEIYDSYPGNKNAKMLNKNDFKIIES